MLYAALARDAWRVRDLRGVTLLAVCLTAAYTLGPLAGREQTLALQWLEQSINAVGQAAFVVAARRLMRTDRPTPRAGRSLSTR